MKVSLVLSLVIGLLLLTGQARAGQLADRLASFPNWQDKPPVTVAEGDLIYPDWMAGRWNVTSTLVEQVAPLAPDIVTPGFEGNRRYLNQPIQFQVQFVAIDTAPSTITTPFIPIQLQPPAHQQLHFSNEVPVIVADRAFNGLNIAKAYLGEDSIKTVKVDPNSPNRQITTLSTGHQLISVVTGRASEQPNPDQFIATEVSTQVFRGTSRPYVNQVETTTDYHRRQFPELAIEANQITAVYLSPQDADYFKAGGKPVALYRYRLELEPVERH